GRVPALAQKGLGAYKDIDISLPEKLCDRGYHMRSFPFHLEPSESGFPKGCQSALAALRRQKALQLLLRLHGNNHHSSAQADQTKPLLLHPSQMFKNGNSSDFRGHILLRPHKGELLFFDVIAKDKQAEILALSLIFRQGNLPDAVHFSA